MTDGSLTAPGSATLDITPVNDAPVANNDSASGSEDTTIAGNVLINDGGVASGLTAVLVSGPSHGSLMLNGDGSFSYTPDADWHGTDSFSYRATDGTLDSNTATNTITVSPVNDAPTASPVTLAPVAQSGSVRVITQTDLLANAADVDGDRPLRH